MNDNHIEIKEKRNGLIAKGIIFLILSVLSLTIALLPYMLKDFNGNPISFYLGGGIAFCCFATVFIFLLFKECNPDSVIILNSRGFIDKNNVGSNIEIEWTNVAAVKLMGKKEMPYLGITLENADLVMVHMKKPYVEEMRENIEEGLPHILLSQREIRYPINDLKDLFVKFTREARALKNDAPAKPKNNPFTTEDVLRAFGKLDSLPQEDKVETIKETTLASELQNQDSTKQADESDEPHNASDVKSVDSFYETLIRKSIETSCCAEENQTAAAINEPVTETEEKDDEINAVSENDELNDEFIELIAKARSSKIAEIEKMLNEKDVPFSSSRKTEVQKKEEKEEAPSQKENEDTTNDSEAQGDTTPKQDNKASMSDTKEFYPEIIHFDDI